MATKITIPHTLVSSVDTIPTTQVEHEYLVLFLLCCLHYHKKINDERLKALFASLRKGTLLRRVGTYHCKINDKWYNDEAMFVVLIEAYKDVCPRENMPFDVFLKYLNLYSNKNKNYCIDILYFQYIKPLVDNVEYYKSLSVLRDFGFDENKTFKTFEEVMRTEEWVLTGGFCCEDCDGDYRQYKLRKYEYYYKDQRQKALKESVAQWLLNQKTPSAYKNMNEKLSKE